MVRALQKRNRQVGLPTRHVRLGQADQKFRERSMNRSANLINNLPAVLMLLPVMGGFLATLTVLVVLDHSHSHSHSEARDGVIDVVIGVVETHGRAETAALVGDLEQVPRRRIEYRGVVLEELDLDAVLAFEQDPHAADASYARWK